MGSSPPILGEVIDPREVVVEVMAVCWEVTASGNDIALVLGVLLLLGMEVIVTEGRGSLQCYGDLPHFRFTSCCC